MPRPKRNNAMYPLRLPEKMLTEAQTKAARQGSLLSEVLRDLLRRWLKKERRESDR